MRAIAAAGLVTAVLMPGVTLPPAPQGALPPLKELLRRVGAYVQAFGEQGSFVVGSEHYTQDVSRNNGRAEERRIVAELAIVRDEQLHQWLGFRDVVEVDGKPVTDHEDRLTAILTSRPDGVGEARALSDEGARFNLGRVYRNFNVPTTALFFFTPANMDRFKCSERGRAADGSVELAFHEKQKPTIIRTETGGSVPSEGEIWVDPATGTIRRTRLRFADLSAVLRSRGLGTIEIDVTYALVDHLGMWLPQTMREEYDVITSGTVEREDGRADYSNYRRFQTSVRIK